MNILHRARVIYRAHRRALHRRLVASMRKPYTPRIYVGKPEMQFDERSSIDRFRRESGRR